MDELSAKQTAPLPPAQPASALSRTAAGIPQRAGVGEHGAGDAEIVRHEREREADFRRGRPVHGAAERVAGVQVARTVAGAVEAAHRLTALEEQVDQANILATPAVDRATDGAATKVMLSVIG